MNAIKGRDMQLNTHTRLPNLHGFRSKDFRAQIQLSNHPRNSSQFQKLTGNRNFTNPSSNVNQYGNSNQQFRES